LITEGGLESISEHCRRIMEQIWKEREIPVPVFPQTFIHVAYFPHPFRISRRVKYILP
jgi:hypothetical protein